MTGSCKTNHRKITTTMVPMSYTTHSKPYSDYETDADWVLRLSRAYTIYQVGPLFINMLFICAAHQALSKCPCGQSDSAECELYNNVDQT